jgi:hypothetical protein
MQRPRFRIHSEDPAEWEKAWRWAVRHQDGEVIRALLDYVHLMAERIPEWEPKVRLASDILQRWREERGPSGPGTG